MSDDDPRAVARRRGQTSGGSTSGGGGSGSFGRQQQQTQQGGFNRFNSSNAGGSDNTQGATKRILDPDSPVGGFNESLKEYVKPVEIAGTTIQPILLPLLLGGYLLLGGKQGILLGMVAYFFISTH